MGNHWVPVGVLLALSGVALPACGGNHNEDPEGAATLLAKVRKQSASRGMHRLPRGGERWNAVVLPPVRTTVTAGGGPRD